MVQIVLQLKSFDPLKPFKIQYQKDKDDTTKKSFEFVFATKNTVFAEITK